MHSGPARRFVSLDGLRGVAAAVVVVHHAMVTLPLLADPYISGAVAPGLRWLVYSPLHLLWDGSAPVFIFFVLSGLVVPLPALRDPAFRWRSFYPQRLIRLYLPVWGTLVLAYALLVIVPRIGSPAHSAWIDWHAQQWSLRQALHDALLVQGTSAVDMPLWSLQWEVIFSLLLPVYVLLSRLARRSDAAALAVALGATALSAAGGWFGIAALTYLPMFAVGIAIGARLDRLRQLSAVLSRRPIAIGVGAFALACLSSRWCLTPLLGSTAYPSTFGPALVGSALIVLLACSSEQVGRLLTSRPALRLGAISFSLYLVHEPVLVTLAFLLPPALVGLVPVVGIPLAVPIALLMLKLVEQPAHRLARRVGRAMGRWGRTDVSAATSPSGRLDRELIRS